jgi:hypothetical protein
MICGTTRVWWRLRSFCRRLLLPHPRHDTAKNFARQSPTKGARQMKIRFIRPDREGNCSVLFYANTLPTNVKWSTKNAQFNPLTEILTCNIDDMTVHICVLNSSICPRGDMSQWECHRTQEDCHTVFGNDLDSV